MEGRQEKWWEMRAGDVIGNEGWEVEDVRGNNKRESRSSWN